MRLLMDGATGTALLAAGMPPGACTALWILENPEALLQLQRRYAAAGCDVITAPTFGANRVRLEQHGIFGQVADYNRRLVELSRRAAGGRGCRFQCRSPGRCGCPCRQDRSSVCRSRR